MKHKSIFQLLHLWIIRILNINTRLTKRVVLFSSLFTILIINVSGTFSPKNKFSSGNDRFLNIENSYREIPVNTNASIHDQSIPGCAGGWIALHAEAGIYNGDFHITFERDEKGYYAYFNGFTWEAPVNITDDKIFRSGIHMAVDPRNGDVHFCWGTDDKRIKYRMLSNQTLSETETIVADVAWRQADITVDNNGIVYLVANTISDYCLSVHIKKPGSLWSTLEIPYNDDFTIWAATIVHTPDNGLYVACRRKDKHPTLWWHYNGAAWNGPNHIPGHNYEPNLVVTSSDFSMACYGSQLKPLFIGPDNIRIQISEIQGCLRGAHVGLVKTSDGYYYSSFSSMNGNKGTETIDNREVDSEDLYYFAVSKDNGFTWNTFRVTNDNTGQGWGSIAANGNKVLFIWPDMRGGKHLRYSIIESSVN